MMHYIIDGYNLFFKIEQQINPLEKKREHFVSALNREIQALNLNVTIIFDSDAHDTPSFPSKKELDALEVIFAPKNLSADEYILEMLSWNSNTKQEVIVTSDRELSTKAKALHAKTKTIEDFLRFLTKKQSRKHYSDEEKKVVQESDANIKRLLAIFEKRLND